MYKYCTILLLVEYCNLCVVGATMLHTHSVVCLLAWFWRGCACFLIHVAAVQPEHAQHSNYALQLGNIRSRQNLNITALLVPLLCLCCTHAANLLAKEAGL